MRRAEKLILVFLMVGSLAAVVVCLAADGQSPPPMARAVPAWLPPSPPPAVCPGPDCPNCPHCPRGERELYANRPPYRAGHPVENSSLFVEALIRRIFHRRHCC